LEVGIMGFGNGICYGKELSEHGMDVGKGDWWVWNTNVYIVKSSYSKVKTISIDVEDDLFGQLWNIKALPIIL